MRRAAATFDFSFRQIGGLCLAMPKTPTPRQRSRAIPNRHYAAIAKCIHTWAALEFEVDRMIWSLLDVPQPIGACVTAQLVSVIPKLKALTSLTNLYGAAASAAELKKFTGEMGGLNDHRNRLGLIAVLCG